MQARKRSVAGGRSLAGELKRGAAHHRAGRFAEAEAAYRRVLAAEPDNPDALHLLGVIAHQARKHAAAVELIGRALAVAPDFAEAHNSLGVALHAAGKPEGAVAAYRRALALKPKYPEAHNNLGKALKDEGLLDEAVAAHGRALVLRPGFVEAHNDLGVALQSQGRPEAAAVALRRALELKPDYADAHCNLAVALYDEADPAASLNAFDSALRAVPDNAKAHFYAAMIHEQMGAAAAAAVHWDWLGANGSELDHLRDSWNYAKRRRGPSTRFLSHSFQTLGFAIDQSETNGLVLEFGVRFGKSIRFIAARTDQAVHGFDSFEGLPEAWGASPAGTYTTSGVLPNAPPNVHLHAGLFADTLPGFVSAHPGSVRFMNVDCDIYSSAKTVLEHLGNRIVPGTVIVFDEYFCNPNWRNDEYKAFQEAVRENDWRYAYIAFNMFTKQAAVKLL